MIDNPICNEYQRCVSPAGLHVQDEEKSNQQAALVSSPDACADLGGVIALHASWLSLPQFETSFLKPRSSLFSNRIELPVTRWNLSSVRTGEEEKGHVAPERHKREVVMKDRKGGCYEGWMRVLARLGWGEQMPEGEPNIGTLSDLLAWLRCG